MTNKILLPILFLICWIACKITHKFPKAVDDPTEVSKECQELWQYAAKHIFDYGRKDSLDYLVEGKGKNVLQYFLDGFLDGSEYCFTDLPRDSIWAWLGETRPIERNHFYRYTYTFPIAYHKENRVCRKLGFNFLVAKDSIMRQYDLAWGAVVEREMEPEHHGEPDWSPPKLPWLKFNVAVKSMTPK